MIYGNNTEIMIYSIKNNKGSNLCKSESTVRQLRISKPGVEIVMIRHNNFIL